jgi:16S rRNA G966 N2-methylase RsmD
MKAYDGTNGICKAGQDVCKLMILACKKTGGLRPAVDKLKESLFVCF